MNIGLMTTPKRSSVFGLETSVESLSTVITHTPVQSGVSSVVERVYF